VAQLTRSGVNDPAEEPGIRRQDFFEKCEKAWRNFDQQPGMYLRWERVKRSARPSRVEFELRAAGQQAIASLRGDLTISAAGRRFTLNTLKIPDRSTADSWPPGIAELAARSWQDQAGHFAAETMTNKMLEARGIRELIDETGTPLLYTSGHNFDCRAPARITFPDQRWLRFMVRGTHRQNAIMTAIDQAGHRVARYRQAGQRFLPWATTPVEIVIHPDRKLTDELMLAIAISPPWLHSYFDHPDGGG
jgi:hypothetical protein